MKTLAIINPISGKQRRSAEEWRQPIALNFPQATVAFTERAGHATELAAQAVNQHVEQILVAGGDGTINEVARALVNTPVALGIIPKGSGNGLARELGMPLAYEEALVALQKTEKICCDVGVANGEYFLNVAGVGIEAEIAQQFDIYGKAGTRGKWPYFKLALQTIFRYTPPSLHLSYNGKEETRAPLTLVFANGTQYGSGFYIAPQANLTDGKLEMVEIKNVSKWKLLIHIVDFFQKNPLPPQITATQPVQQIEITSARQIVYHIDGEPKIAGKKLTIQVLPHALHLLKPKGN